MEVVTVLATLGVPSNPFQDAGSNGGLNSGLLELVAVRSLEAWDTCSPHSLDVVLWRDIGCTAMDEALPRSMAICTANAMTVTPSAPTAPKATPSAKRVVESVAVKVDATGPCTGTVGELCIRDSTGGIEMGGVALGDVGRILVGFGVSSVGGSCTGGEALGACSTRRGSQPKCPCE
eukprot:CAMPEP_0171135812 /NCGR_PEP_ID=MMETSP0766_2-20121228/130401_1 /TAXON_ID=439317 /ORGANISM="Gambierdiscus australes, Strain CAWD 149" /LENGTH=176 /DNA_ID=CAMNT_0011599329 /DNA_START=299 /DNA_END=829 /DNA_ORIENTATION=-